MLYYNGCVCGYIYVCVHRCSVCGLFVQCLEQVILQKYNLHCFLKIFFCILYSLITSKWDPVFHPLVTMAR